MSAANQYRVEYQGVVVFCSSEQTLRDALLASGASPHNGSAHYLNCRGLGSCGTCAMRVEGELNPPTKMEKLRLAFPPHTRDSGLRLACQVKPRSDLIVKKEAGFWGQK